MHSYFQQAVKWCRKWMWAPLSPTPELSWAPVPGQPSKNAVNHSQPRTFCHSVLKLSSTRTLPISHQVSLPHGTTNTETSTNNIKKWMMRGRGGGYTRKYYKITNHFVHTAKTILEKRHMSQVTKDHSWHPKTAHDPSHQRPFLTPPKQHMIQVTKDHSWHPKTAHDPSHQRPFLTLPKQHMIQVTKDHSWHPKTAHDPSHQRPFLTLPKQHMIQVTKDHSWHSQNSTWSKSPKPILDNPKTAHEPSILTAHEPSILKSNTLVLNYLFVCGAKVAGRWWRETDTHARRYGCTCSSWPSQRRQTWQLLLLQTTVQAASRGSAAFPGSSACSCNNAVPAKHKKSIPVNVNIFKAGHLAQNAFTVSVNVTNSNLQISTLNNSEKFLC